MPPDQPQLVGKVRIERGVTIGYTSVIGKPYRKVGGKPSQSRRAVTVLGTGSEIGDHVTVMRGVRLGSAVSIDDQCLVEPDVDIGAGSRLIYHAIVCDGAKIGQDCIIGGFIGERSKIGDGSRIFGSLVHRQDNPSAPWDGAVERAPNLGHHVLVGFGAVVIGGIRVGHQSIISAGALVTRQVPPGSIVSGVNQVVHHSRSEMKVARSPWFRGT